MLLSIDIGNSNIAFGIYDRGWIHHWRLNTVANKTADEYEVMFRTLIENSRTSIKNINQVVVSSVVPPLTSTIKRMISSLFQQDPLMVNSELDTGILIKIDNPQEIGSDLLANAVAGYTLYHSNCIIVDFGTALSLTIVNAQGELLGGSIAPGLESAMKALSTNTAQLPFVQLIPPPHVVGKNTVHAIQSGIVLGYVGMVEYLVENIKKELKGETKVIATGGLSEVIAPLTNKFTTIEPWLTLDGLRLIAEKNLK